MKKSSWFLLSVFLALGVGTARANSIGDYDIRFTVSGIFVPLWGPPGECPVECYITGTMVTNTKSGALISADIYFYGLSNYFFDPLNAAGVYEEGGLTVILAAGADTTELGMVVQTEIPGSLVGYEGGPLSTDSFFTGYYGDDPMTLVSGELTPDIPEPSSFLLFATALCALLVVINKKRRGRTLPMQTARQMMQSPTAVSR